MENAGADTPLAMPQKKLIKGPQRYFVPELNQDIKVESTGATNRYVAHFPTGPERVMTADIKDGKWEHKGHWDKVIK